MNSAAWTVLALALVTSGCADPSKDKTKADVGAAKSVASNAAKGDKYTLDASASKVDFAGSNVTATHNGGFKKVSGTATLNGNDVAGAFVSIEIDVSSTYSDDDKLTGHLLSDDFFGAKEFPKAKFVTTEIKKGGDKGATHTVTGNLTIRGKAKSISFPATIKKDGDKISVTSEFSIQRKDFGIMYAGKKDDLIRDGVVMKLSLSLKLSPS
jgi:polyisoprenoid-binding protein YceI